MGHMHSHRSARGRKRIYSNPVSRHERLAPQVVKEGIAWARKCIIHSARAVVITTHILLGYPASRGHLATRAAAYTHRDDFPT